LAQKCRNYDDISSRIYHTRDNLWTSTVKKGVDSEASVRTQNPREPKERIMGFCSSEVNSNSKKNESGNDSIQTQKLKGEIFINCMNSLYSNHEQVIENFFGDVKVGFYHSQLFEYQTFRKLVKWFQKVLILCVTLYTLKIKINKK
jgi:hypothetical protein